MRYLDAPDIAAFGTTCRFFSAVADNGALWRDLFVRMYPKSRLTAGCLAAWKTSFVLERNSMSESLQCFFTRDSFEDDVIGVPITYTVNPRTGQKDYISSTFDTLSLGSYTRHGVRSGVWNEPFQAFLPLYINDDHFDRALPQLRGCIAKLAGCQTFAPTQVLDVIGSMMNTQAVLVVDKGVRACERVLEGYCLLFHLLLGFCKKYPRLLQEVHARFERFCSNPGTSTAKDQFKSLGNLIPLLAVSSKIGWRDVSEAYLLESFDRQVLWNCRHYPELSVVLPEEKARDGGGEEEDMTEDLMRLRKTLDAAKVSTRVMMFHSFFVNIIARPSGQSLADVFDHFRSSSGGRAPPFACGSAKRASGSSVSTSGASFSISSVSNQSSG